MKLVFCVAAMVLAGSAEAARYEVSEIGPLKAGHGVLVNRLNDLGQVAGYSSDENGSEAFLWSRASGATLISQAGSAFSYAYDVNNSGQVVGKIDGKSFVWDAATGLKHLRTASQKEGGEALVITATGQIAGWTTLGSDLGHATIWDDATARSSVIGASPFSAFSGGGANGLFAGYQNEPSVNGNLDLRAIVWSDADGITELGTFGVYDRPGPALPRNYSNARDANVNGVVVGYSSAPDGERAFWWTRGTGLHDMGDLDGGTVMSRARAINSHGQVVGFSSATSGWRATLWDQVTGLPTDLNTLVDPALGWSLDQAYDINERGEIIGIGFNRAGQQVGFLLSPLSGVPEPNEWLLMVVGFGALGTIIRKARCRSMRSPKKSSMKHA